MKTRRSGWVVLFAVAAATVAAAFAVRAGKKRKKPASPISTPRAADDTRTDPARALVRMAIGAGVFVVLAIVTVVVTAPSGDGAVTPSLVMTPSAGPNGMYTRVAVPGPVDRAERVVLTGDDGARVEIGIQPAGERPTPGLYPNEQNLAFKVHLRNTGQVWVGTRLDPNAWVLDSTGASYQSNDMLSIEGGPYGSTDPQENPAWRLEPGWEADRLVVFTVPEGVRLTRLHLVVPMGGAMPAAEWNL